MSIPRSIETLPLRRYSAKDVLIEEGGQDGCLYFLMSGNVEVSKQGVNIAKVRERGAMFGEMSVLLGCPHTASVSARDEVECSVAVDGAAFLRAHPDVMFYVAETLARRLDSLNKYLLDVKAQFAEQEGHLGMVDGVLEALMTRHPKRVPAPRDPEP